MFSTAMFILVNRAESVTETEYREILKNRNRRRYWETEKYRKTEEKNEKPKIRFLLMMIFTISTIYIFWR